MKNILLFLWQLPQIVLGWILGLFYPAEKSLVYKGIKVIVSKKFPGGISLGNVIIVKKFPHNYQTWVTVKHEYGHTVQSRKWGWLYLIVIGLPSFCCCVWSKLFHTRDRGWSISDSNKWYYNLPWEEAADELGGVDRWGTL